MKKTLSLLLAVLLLGLCAAAYTEAESPLRISVYYNDNSTYPFREDWRAINIGDGLTIQSPRTGGASWIVDEKGNKLAQVNRN